MKMHLKRIGSVAALLAGFVAISACGGGGGGGSAGSSSGGGGGGGGVSGGASETFLYSFGTTGAGDGSSPYAGLVMDSAGNLYGTTENGGLNGTGTVFKITPTGSESIVYSFGPSSGTDGQNPQGGLIIDSAGYLYGTTFDGGANNNGTVFKMTTAGNEVFLYSFGPNTTADGKLPAGRLIMDSIGDLWGTTTMGGTGNDGTVFEINPFGSEAFVYSFTGASGWHPYDGLIADASGNFYGTTRDGGSNGTGVVFKIIPSSHSESVLYSFGASGSSDAQNPKGCLVRDSAGNLYGTTTAGGANSLGTVFKVTSSGTESVLYSFATIPDGDNPIDGMIMDSAGNLYGTTYGGGAYGQGTVFEITSAGSESVLYSFGAASNDGSSPYYGSLFRDSSGNLYGTTVGGGANGIGTVFKIN